MKLSGLGSRNRNKKRDSFFVLVKVGCCWREGWLGLECVIVALLWLWHMMLLAFDHEYMIVGLL